MRVNAVAVEHGSSPLQPLVDWRETHGKEIFSRFELRLREIVRESSSVPIRDLALNAVDGSGKRLRPLLVFLAGSFGSLQSKYEQQLVDAAVAVELVHTASLLHDDMIDATEIRRGDPALYTVWGASAGARVGAHLLYLAGRIVQSLDLYSVDVYNQVRVAFASAATAACAGQFQELLHFGDREVNEQTYQIVISRKTAQLFHVAAETGGLIACAPSAALAEFGNIFGVLYQIIDDVRDIFEDEQHLQRPPGADLASGVYTLPTILALARPGPHRDRISALLGPGNSTLLSEDLLALQSAILVSGAAAATLGRAQALGKQAKSQLLELPQSAARSAMEQAIDSMIRYLDALLDRPEHEGVAACVGM